MAEDEGSGNSRKETYSVRRILEARFSERGLAPTSSELDLMKEYYINQHGRTHIEGAYEFMVWLYGTQPIVASLKR